MPAGIIRDSDVELRKFGVGNSDEYWSQRREESRVSERRLHRFLSSLVDEMFPYKAKVLDCGVGSGHVFRLCSEKHETYGVELSAEAIAMFVPRNIPTFVADNTNQERTRI